MQAGHGSLIGREVERLRSSSTAIGCIAVKHGREITLFSRHEKVLNKRFPRIVDALGSLEGDFVLDGELVALDPQGRPSFQVLQNNLSRSLPVYFYCFDPLTRDGETVPIERRRDLLDRMFAAPKDPLRLSPLLQAPSGQVVEAVRNLGLEGVVGKRVELHGPTATSCGGWQAEFARHTCQFRVCRPITPALIATLIPNGTYISSQLSRGSTCCRIRYRRFSQPGGLWAYC